jgi:hypothetical protein
MVALTGLEEFMRSMSPVSSNHIPVQGSALGDARKRRLDALKARCKDLSDALAEAPTFAKPARPVAMTPAPKLAAPVAPKAFNAVPQQVVSLLQGNGAKAQDMRRLLKENAAKLMQILTRTPADGRGHLPGTPFTVAGIQRLSQLLHQRAGQQGAPGRKIASMALQMLSEPDPAKPTIEGLSNARIQGLWQQAEQIFRKTGGNPAAFGGRPGGLH